jgi:hypothetical protein
VTSSILDNKNLTTNKVKAHVTRIPNKVGNALPVSITKKKQPTLVIPRSAINTSTASKNNASSLMQYTGALSIIGEEKSTHQAGDDTIMGPLLSNLNTNR